MCMGNQKGAHWRWRIVAAGGAEEGGAGCEGGGARFSGRGTAFEWGEEGAGAVFLPWPCWPSQQPTAQHHRSGWPTGEAEGAGKAEVEADGWAWGECKKRKRWINFQIQKLVLPWLQKLPKIYWRKIKLPRTQCHNKNSKSY
jgi:hypothetical protein